MPCLPSRARELIKKGMAIPVRTIPFVIQLKNRLREDSIVQPIRLGVDPGSKTTGMALSRDDKGVRNVLFKLEITHRSALIHQRMQQRANYRRRRRSVNLRYRAPRFLNRTKSKDWLPPSLFSRIQHITTWTKRLQRWCPISIIDLELVKFDTQKMQNPEINGVEYQRGTLYGYEVREYLLEKFNRKCVYCNATNIPLNIDHVIPRSRGGSNRISNLVLACISCNKRKDNQSIEKFCPLRSKQIRTRMKIPLRDAAAINSTRYAVRKVLLSLGILVECSNGGRTKWNRHQFNITKTHALDAVCVGKMIGITRWNGPTLKVQSTGRGTHQRTRTNRYGFPRLKLPRYKHIYGFSTGDLVVANVLRGKHIGVHIGRVVVRSTGLFRVGTCDGINYKSCVLMQRQDGYACTST